MIIKKMDSKQEEITELTALLKGRLTSNERFVIERELKTIKSGVSGEKGSAYYIDFYFENSKNWAVIHDLRLEHRGKVARVDHLLINRFFDMYVLESKNYSHRLKITPERRIPDLLWQRIHRDSLSYRTEQEAHSPPRSFSETP